MNISKKTEQVSAALKPRQTSKMKCLAKIVNMNSAFGEDSECALHKK